jgi:hypothetical protein
MKPDEILRTVFEIILSLPVTQDRDPRAFRDTMMGGHCIAVQKCGFCNANCA